jgi:predicted  nucleic acid-binding Zn-ribbon protein
MTHKHEIPGVDPDALDDLAKQFPPAAAKPDPEPVTAPPRPQTVIVKKRAWFALLLSWLALLGAAAALAMPTIKPWLKANYGTHPAVALVVGPRTEIEILQGELNGLRGQLATLSSRVEAGETNVSGTAERLGRLEKATEGLEGRLDTLAAGQRAPAAETAIPAAPAEVEAWGKALTQRIETIDPLARRVEVLEGGLGDAAGRLNGMETRLVSVNKRLEAFDAVGGNVRTVIERLNGTEDGLAALRAKVDANAAAAAAAVAGLEKLSGLAAAVDQRLADLEGPVGAVDSRLAALEGGAKDERTLVRSIRLAVAIQQLGTVSHTHKPFSREVEQVRRLSADRGEGLTALDTLSTHADTGVATVAELRDSFAAILVPKLRSLVDGGDKPWTDRMREWMSAAIAPAGQRPAEQNPALKLIDDTVQRLAEDDLRGAIDVLAQLEGPPANLSQRWLVEARARLAVDGAAESLAALALDLVGNKP